MKQFIFTGTVWLITCMTGISAKPTLPQPISTEKYASADSGLNSRQFVTLLFWNVENLFDHRDDTLTLDEEFTPGGGMHWNYSKMQQKINKLAKTMLAAGEWDPPAIIGLCEIENRYVLNKLVYSSPLAPFRYRIIHRNSPDQRGIDVALIYRDTLFVPVYSRWIPVRFPFDTAVRTRDILYVKGILCGADTLHLFVNHWPSRRGGEKQSAPRRNYVAALLRSLCDSILEVPFPDPSSRIPDPVSRIPYPASRIPDPASRIPCVLLMGDFNDEPDNASLSQFLRAVHPDSVCGTTRLVNLMYPKLHKEGSHKFREHWGLLDQFIVSTGLLSGQTHSTGNQPGSIRIVPGKVRIFRPAFLLEEDLKYLDKKPSRTYVGPRYKGGFSDHLPIILQLETQR